MDVIGASKDRLETLNAEISWRRYQMSGFGGTPYLEAAMAQLQRGLDAEIDQYFQDDHDVVDAEHAQPDEAA